MKIHKTSKRLPKLLPINPKKKRYQSASKKCIVWWKWANDNNNKPSPINPIEPRIGRLYKNNVWSIEGIQGSIIVTHWMYIPKIK